METAVGAANWLLNRVLQKLSDDLVVAFVSSKELGLDYEKIRTQLLETKAVLHVAQQRDMSGNDGLQGLLEMLSEKADEADDALDELHYFKIQDKLDGTRKAIPDSGDGLSNDVLHFRHAARHTAGNCLTYFSCCRTQDVASRKSVKLRFDRVEMSKKIKAVIEEMHSLCVKSTTILQLCCTANPQRIGVTLERPPTSSKITQDKLYGRDAIFSQTINDMTTGMYHETLSVLPISGPGGIGKTTFAQHLYNHETIKELFPVRVWVCVPINFDVVKLTREILSCILAVENEDRNGANNISNLSTLHEYIEQRLKTKRFLLVLDDMWECNIKSEWETLLAPFRKGETKGNMVLVTTRAPKIAAMVREATNQIDLQGLEPDEFWKFFQVCVFGEVKDGQKKGYLIEIAKDISAKLKCSPLAARTVGPLLQKNQSPEHWMKILENKEWQKLNHKDDIMPALKISYDYLPYHLKKCFSYCSLFPEDHTFDRPEITRFWISIGVLDSMGQNGTLEDKGSRCLDELVENGFFTKKDDNCYAMHDLLYELSQNVSSQECAHINLHFKAMNISRSIRHLSISMENKFSQNFVDEMSKLEGTIKIENLRSLMFFGEYNSVIIDSGFKNIFNKLKGLRVLFIFVDSSKSLPYSFSKLVHLQYLKIESPTGRTQISLPVTISRFYHLKFLNLEKWHGRYDLPKDMNRLVNLRHFLAQKEFHSNVLEVGKMESLEELKEFQIKKNSSGFEISELGKLTELGGTLSICNIEKVETREEASTAELMKKRNLCKLRLVWSRDQRTIENDVIDGLQPHPNLRKLTIVNHGCSSGPSWLPHHGNGITSLQSLHLENISWGNLPPLGLLPNLMKLKLKNIAGMRRFGPDFGGDADKSLINLKTIVFRGMPELVDWVVEANSHMFPRVERIECVDCPNFIELPFSVSIGPSRVYPVLKATTRYGGWGREFLSSLAHFARRLILPQNLQITSGKTLLLEV